MYIGEYGKSIKIAQGIQLFLLTLLTIEHPQIYIPMFS